jgi:hypothetical protein
MVIRPNFMSFACSTFASAAQRRAWVGRTAAAPDAIPGRTAMQALISPFIAVCSSLS